MTQTTPASPTERLTLSVSSEYEPLKAVLVHEPGLEIDRLTPENREQYLFEDIPDVERIKDEHKAFCKELENLDKKAGVKIYHLRKLLTDVIQCKDDREWLIRELCSLHNKRMLVQPLAGFDDKRLLDTMFAGITHHELDRLSRDDDFLIPPSPNAYFMRDPATIVNSTAISCKAHFRARLTEGLLVKAVLEKHPLFGNPPIIGGTNCTVLDHPYEIEGGDVAVVNADAVMIGFSQRTSWRTVDRVAKALCAKRVVKRVYQVEIPSARWCMHLDTVFTILGPGTILMYPPALADRGGFAIRKLTLSEATGELDDEPMKVTIDEVLKDELVRMGYPPNTRRLETAGGQPRYMSREQRADGTNMLAVDHNKVVSYKRNKHTNDVLRFNNIEVVEIEGSELVRGLGGPRCMTMPLVRVARSSTE